MEEGRRAVQAPCGGVAAVRQDGEDNRDAQEEVRTPRCVLRSTFFTAINKVQK